MKCTHCGNEIEIESIGVLEAMRRARNGYYVRPIDDSDSAVTCRGFGAWRTPDGFSFWKDEIDRYWERNKGKRFKVIKEGESR